MNYKNILKASCELLRAFFVLCLRGQYELDRQLFLLTGLRTPILRAVWEHQAERLQRALDFDHITRLGWMND